MKVQLSAKFEIEDWNESPLDDRSDVSKVTRAVVNKNYAGDIEGTSITEWLMAYLEDGSAEFVGMERISGSVGGQEGTLVLRHIGAYQGGAARGVLQVVTGASSGELRSAAGSGEFLADPSGSITLDLTEV
jgi:hypothetical protein